MGNAITLPEAPSFTWEEEPYYIEHCVNPVLPPKATSKDLSSSSLGEIVRGGSSDANLRASSSSSSSQSNTALSASLLRFTGGRVFTLANENFSKHLAIKIYDKFAAIDLVHWLIVRRKLCSKLSGAPYIVPIYKTYQDEARLYMVMPFYTGGDLAHYIDNGFAFTYKAARSAIATVVVALQHLHVHGIVHEDVRPENIFIDAGGACHLALTKTSLWLFNAKFPRPRLVVDYTSPEVLRGEQPTPASDWWSFGAVFAHMVQGHPPFDAPNEKLLKRHIFSEPPNLSYSLPAPLKALLTALLNKDPAARLSSAAKVISHPFFAKIDWDAVRSHSYESMLQPSREGSDLIAARNSDGELMLETPAETVDPAKQAAFATWDWHPKRKHQLQPEQAAHKTIENDHALLSNAQLLSSTGCPVESTVDGVGRVIFSLAELPVGRSFQTLNGNKLTRTDEHTCLLYVPRKRETRYELFIPAQSSDNTLSETTSPAPEPSSSTTPSSVESFTQSN